MDDSCWDAREAQYALEDALLDVQLDAARSWEVTDYWGGDARRVGVMMGI
jgi:hypothetical protein